MKDIKLISGIILMNFESRGVIKIKLNYNQYRERIIVHDKIEFEKVLNDGTVVYINNYSKLGIKGYSKAKRTIVEISQKIVIDHIGNLIYEGIHHGIITIHTSSGKYDISDHVTIVHYKDESYSDNIFNKLKE